MSMKTDMPPRKQKNKKTWILFIILAVLLLPPTVAMSIFWLGDGSIYRSNGSGITNQEWFDIVSDTFGNDRILPPVNKPEKRATVRDAVLFSMEVLGDDRISGMSGKSHLNNKEKINLAVNQGIVSSEQLNEPLTREMAGQFASAILDYYYDPEYYPEYFEMKTKVDFHYTDQWDMMDFNEGDSTITANIKQDIPQIGEVIAINGNYGILDLMYVDSIEQQGDGSYYIKLSEVEELGDVIEHMEFSGASDFSYLLDDEQREQFTSENLKIREPFVRTVYAESHEREISTHKCDIEFGGEFKVSNGEPSFNGCYVKKLGGDDAGLAKKADISYENGELNVSGEVTANTNTTAINAKFSNVDENVWAEKKEFGLGINMELKGLSVTAEGSWDKNLDFWKKLGKPIEIRVNIDRVIISTSARLEGEKMIPIGGIPIPIAETGLIVNLRLYVVVNAKGEIGIAYSVDDVIVGVDISAKDGCSPTLNYGTTDLKINANATIQGGVVFEAALSLANKDKFDIVDPSIDVRYSTSIKTLEVPVGWELKPEYKDAALCIAQKNQGPLVKLNFMTGKDSMLYELFAKDGVSDLSIDIIKEDSDKVPFREEYHMEYATGEVPYKRKLGPADEHTNICTHIQPKNRGYIPEFDKYVNDKVLDEVRYSKPSEFKFQIYDMVFQTCMKKEDAEAVIKNSKHNFTIKPYYYEDLPYENRIEVLGRGYSEDRIVSDDGIKLGLVYLDDVLRCVYTDDGEKRYCGNMFDDETKKHTYFFNGINAYSSEFTREYIEQLVESDDDVTSWGHDGMMIHLAWMDNWEYEDAPNGLKAWAIYDLSFNEDGTLKDICTDLYVD